MNKIIISVFVTLLSFSFLCTKKNEDGLKSDDTASLNSANNHNFIQDQEETTKKLENKQKAIKLLSNEYNFINLKEKKLKDGEFELRIWSNIEFYYVKCFVLSKSQNTWSASLYVPKLVDGEIERTKNNIIVARKDSLHPQSSWEELYRGLNERKLFDPIPFSLEKEFFFAGEDEGTIVLEIKQNTKYELVFYREFTKEENGKELFSLCQYLEKELNTEIGCGKP